MNPQDILLRLLIGFPLPPEMVDPRFPLFLQRAGGLLLTLLITSFSLMIGAGIGMILALCRREETPPIHQNNFDRFLAQALRVGAQTVVEGVRDVPVVLLVLLVFYVPYPLLGLECPTFILAIAALSLYAGAYLSEIMRSGFRSVDPASRDVGKVLGLTPRQVLWRIELPIIAGKMMPDLINIAVTVFKDTSTLAVVAVPELTYTTRQMLMSEPLNYGVILFSILISYWLPATIFSSVALRVEQHRKTRLAT